ncbi:hypothetical protein KDW03_09660 [Thermospira aquatica]|uniref:Uncharacterized protein n=1 Tax=Thermospira aquatica TaxID=2828656 RepID=A0AAX3BBW3_9SPIR|nr:hypothetical protein [Thermospira aquatica]URA09740.1 hypothetical protein KDW03_09660 [Thermospira aquatica]
MERLDRTCGNQNKASKWVREAIKVKGRLPFELRGIDSDTVLNLLIILCVIGVRRTR